MDPIHQQQFQVRSYEVDSKGYLRLSTLLNYFQEMASQHASRLGASVMDLLPRNLTWMLSRYHLRLAGYPRWGERVLIRTWPSGMRQLFATREFELTNDDGELLASATSSWMLLDLQTKRAVRPADHLPDYPFDERRALADPFDPLPSPKQADLALLFQVRQSDLDLNQHANHVAYIEWAMEAVPGKILEIYRPSEIEVAFRGEAFYGDRVMSRTEIQGNTSSRMFLHQIVRGADEKELALLRTQWSKF